MLENLRPLNQRNIKCQHIHSLQKCQYLLTEFMLVSQFTLLLSAGSASVFKS